MEFQRKQELKVLSVNQREIYFDESKKCLQDDIKPYLQAGDLTITLSIDGRHAVQTAMHLL